MSKMVSRIAAPACHLPCGVSGAALDAGSDAWLPLSARAAVFSVSREDHLPETSI